MKCPYCKRDNTFIHRQTILKYIDIDKILDDGEIILGKPLDNKWDGTIDINIQCQGCEKILQDKDYNQRLIFQGYLILLEGR
jgi:phage FluMu protein Com